LAQFKIALTIGFACIFFALLQPGRQLITKIVTAVTTVGSLESHLSETSFI